jgi:hypothetical protein
MPSGCACRQGWKKTRVFIFKKTSSVGFMVFFGFFECFLGGFAQKIGFLGFSLLFICS